MKKNYIYVLIALFVGAAIAFAVVRQGEAKVLSVNEIGPDPSAYSGTITFTGITGLISEDPSVVGILDLKELQCTSANCNKVIIPVKCSQKAPVVGDEVKVTGAFVKEGGGYLFVAKNIDVVRNHKIGG